MNRTVRVILQPTPGQAVALAETSRQFTEVFNAVCAWGWENNERNSVRLHHATYRSLKERLPDLVSDLHCQARVKASESLSNTESFPTVRAGDNAVVRTCTHQFQVLQAVVSFVPILVMNRFGRQEQPTQRLFHNYPVFLHVAILCRWMLWKVKHHISSLNTPTSPPLRRCFSPWMRTRKSQGARPAQPGESSGVDRVSHDVDHDPLHFSALSAGPFDGHHPRNPGRHELYCLGSEIVGRPQ